MRWMPHLSFISKHVRVGPALPSKDPHQHVNHFLNHYELTRKDLLVKSLAQMEGWSLFPEAGSFYARLAKEHEEDEEAV